MSESLILPQAGADVRRRSTRRPTPPGPTRRFGEAILASYSQVLFARSRVVGLTVLAATFVVPERPPDTAALHISDDDPGTHVFADNGLRWR